MRVAVYSADPVGPEMAGPAIRYSELARALEGRFEVILVSGQRAPSDLAGELARADVVFAQLLPVAVMRSLAKAGTRVVYDLYNPYLVEALVRASAQELDQGATFLERRMSAAQTVALRTGAAFVCASERQRDLWLGVLATLDRIDERAYESDRTLRELLDVVPFGIPERPPRSDGSVLRGVLRGVEQGDDVLVWAGGIWDWLDPVTVIRAVAQVVPERPRVRLVFLGTRQPTPGAQETGMTRAARRAADELGLAEKHVFFRDGWTPYAERGAFLTEGDVGVSAHLDTIEARYAIRARLLDHVWAGLPTIASAGDELAELIAARGLGRVVSPGDVDGWAQALREVLRGGAERNFAELRDELSWTRAAAALAPVLANAARQDVRRPSRLAQSRDVLLRAQTSAALGGAARRQLRKLDRRRVR